ncbi:MAG: peptide/nickel transport system permease protein [Thermoleophilaceae bacterium]|nr:peptide/nickel transport system permease protein [Thermoleophilaceae bacterium]
MYIVKRLVSLLFTLWIAVTIVFILFRLVPGDPATVLVGPLASPEAKAALTRDLGLDKPVIEQYGLYLVNLAQGDLGTSYAQRQPVTDLAIPAFRNTFVVVILTFLLAYGIGAVLGVLLAWHRGTKTEAGVTFVALLLRGAPSFWIAILAITFFSVKLGWLPVSGMTSSSRLGEEGLGMYFTLDFVKHLILPVGAATIFAVGLPLLLVRNSMLEVIGTQYMELAEAKGLSPWRVMFRHGARNAMLPAVNASAQFIAWAMGGMIVIENVFSWPGLGREIVGALESRDYMLAQGSLLLIAVLVVTLNLIADLVTAYLDPRIDLA